MVTVMVHSGSVSIGHLCGEYYRDAVRAIYPSSMKHPANGLFPLPDGERGPARLFWDALHNAANFAFANRLFLGLMAWSALRRPAAMWSSRCCMMRRITSCGRKPSTARSSSSTARAPVPPGASTRWMAPRSPTTASPCSSPARWVPAASSSPARESRLALQRQPRRRSDAVARRGPEGSRRGVPPVPRAIPRRDAGRPRRPDVRQRREILDKKLEEIKQEAPFAYKGIGPVAKVYHNPIV